LAISIVGWIVTNIKLIQYGLWSIGLLSVVVASLCIARRASAHMTIQSALVMSLLSGSCVFILLYLSSLTVQVQ